LDWKQSEERKLISTLVNFALISSNSNQISISVSSLIWALFFMHFFFDFFLILFYLLFLGMQVIIIYDSFPCIFRMWRRWEQSKIEI